MTQNGNLHEKHDAWRTQPMYTFSEAAHLAHVSTSTVRNWLRGYVGPGRTIPPLFATHDRDAAMVSFLNLVEIVLAAQFRKTAGISYQTAYHAYSNAREIFHLDYPFAHLSLESIGGHIVQKYRGQPSSASMQSMDTPEQWTLGLPLPDEVSKSIGQLDYSNELASRWHPAGKNVPIVIDPQISAGIPTILGSGVSIPAIHSRFKAGHKIAFIARDYQLEQDTIETAIQYAELVAA